MALPEAALGRGMKLPGAAAKPSCLLVIRHEPHDQCAGACVHIEKRHQGGLEILLAAHDYAADLDRDVWDFAVEIDELRRAGLHNADIRWLVHKGLLEHAHERVAGTGDGREFRQDCRLLLRRRSCFVLTETGMALARNVCQPPRQDHDGVSENHAPSRPVSAQPLMPRWDAARQQLLLGDKIVKEFKVPAANQEQVLAAFEEEGWPVRIDDPLPPRPHQAPKQRLHTTVNALNRNQKHRLIRFCGDGRGQGIRWELLSHHGNGSDSRTADA